MFIVDHHMEQQHKGGLEESSELQYSTWEKIV